MFFSCFQIQRDRGYRGAGGSQSLALGHFAYNDIHSEEAAEAIADMMRSCDTLREMSLSGNHLDPNGAPHIGASRHMASQLRHGTKVFFNVINQ